LARLPYSREIPWKIRSTARQTRRWFQRHLEHREIAIRTTDFHWARVKRVRADRCKNSGSRPHRIPRRPPRDRPACSRAQLQLPVAMRTKLARRSRKRSAHTSPVQPGSQKQQHYGAEQRTLEGRKSPGREIEQMTESEIVFLGILL